MLYFLSNFSSKETLNALYKKELKEWKKIKKKKKERKKRMRKKSCIFPYCYAIIYTLYIFEFLNL